MTGVIIVGIVIFLVLCDIHSDLKEIAKTLQKTNDILETLKPRYRARLKNNKWLPIKKEIIKNGE